MPADSPNPDGAEDEQRIARALQRVSKAHRRGDARDREGADRFGLIGRGRIVEGSWADLVLFDPATVRDRATYDRPHAFPGGIEAVIVEGTVAWRRGEETIGRAGRVLRRPGS